MITAELRGGNKPSLNEALGWIGSKVDDIYGASVGRLEDVWIDPGTGAPKWLLVKEGRFGGRTTLIPFEDATAGAGHVWIPYERDVVREAPPVSPGAPLTQSVETALRSHYAANKPATPTHRGRGQAAAQPEPVPAAAQPPAPGQQVHQYQLLQHPGSQHDPHQPLPPLPPSPPPVPPGRPPRAAHEGPVAPQRPQYVPHAQHQPPPPQARPARSIPQAPPPAGHYAAPPAQASYPGAPGPAARGVPQQSPAPGYGPPAGYQPPPPVPPPTPPPAYGQAPQQHYPQQPAPPTPRAYTPPPAPAPVPPPLAPVPPTGSHAPDDPERPVAIPIIHALDQPYRVEVHLEGDLRISGELKGFSIKPSVPDSGAPGPDSEQ